MSDLDKEYEASLKSIETEKRLTGFFIVLSAFVSPVC